MKALLLAVALAATTASSSAHAGDSDGQWMDVRNHLALGNLPDNSEAIARLDYARAFCRAKTGQVAGVLPVKPGWPVCMKSQGFVYVWDTPAQIAAHEKTANDARQRENAARISNAFGQLARDLAQPHNCNGQVQPNGYFTTQCY